MNNFKKVIAFLCSATLIAGSSITAFAAAPSSTAGDGNIIAYGCETVTVPTASVAVTLIVYLDLAYISP